MRQLPRLFVRGSRYNVTMKELPPDKVDQLNDLVVKVRDMPEMQPCRDEFCRALSRTIGSDYLDPGVAQAEFDIAVMRAGVTVLFHQPVSNDVWQDPIQVKKIFQQWVFNYLRQILRENVIPSALEIHKVRMRGLDSVISAVIERLNQQQIRFDIREIKGGVTIQVNTDNFSVDCLSAFNMMPTKAEDIASAQKFVDLVKKASCKISIGSDGIKIVVLKEVMIDVEVKERKNVKSTSFSGGSNGDDEDSLHDLLEWQVIRRKGVRRCEEPPTWVAELADSIPQEAADVLQIMIDPPREFTKTNTDENARYDVKKIAGFLQQDPSEVRKKIGTIKEVCLCIGVGPQDIIKNRWDEETEEEIKEEEESI
ncbi:MAG: hypothetical protein Q8K86_07275 [Candidatus Nanopelagicaceae bacterium]|nr:hypothetical protein [Candidatus Nanopelagicaceae bacterium]